MAVEMVDEAMERVERLRVQALQEIDSAETTQQLEQVRIRYLGRRAGELDQIRSTLMPQLAGDERKLLGAAVNGARQEIEQALSSREAALGQAELEQRLASEKLDVTLPGTIFPHGYRHPVLETLRELLAILGQMGFSVYEGPEVEWEQYNFDMLNIPKFHPARDMQDTFWVTDDILLRTQTSPGQIRIMQTHQPPLRMVVPGVVYRNEAEDASHLDTFFQIEGLAVDRDVTMGDLKGTLSEVAHRFFGADRRVRFRPSYFPFTEPSAEMDIECGLCRGGGCRSCGYEGWLELLGSGMVHPNVLRAVGYDPEQVSGFAFGMGPDRFTMTKYGVTDLRIFRENDLRFLKQFS